MFSKKVSMGGKQRINISDVLDDIIYCPEVRLLATSLRAFLETTHENTPQRSG